MCLRLNEVKEVSYERLRHSIKVRDPARPEIGHASTKLIAFYYCTKGAETSHIDRPSANLHVFCNCKNTRKKSSYISTRCRKNFLGQHFQNLFRILYTGYQMPRYFIGYHSQLYHYETCSFTIFHFSKLYTVISYST